MIRLVISRRKRFSKRAMTKIRKRCRAVERVKPEKKFKRLDIIFTRGGV